MFSGKIELVWIVVSDLAKAKKFYTEQLGFEVKEANEQFGWIELGSKNGGATLGLAAAQNENTVKPGSNAVITITVKDFEASLAHLKARNVKIVGDVIEIPGQVKMAYFADADGNMFQIACIL